MTEPSKEDLERAFKIVNRVMNKPYNDAKNLKADIAQALAEVRAEGERERKELTRLQRANELFAETHEDLVEQQLEFKSEQDTLTQAIAERDKKIADYHNALEGKKQKIYLLEQRLASLAEKTVDRIYIYEGSDQEAEICNELYREKLVLEQRIRELEGQKTCQHNNITTQVHHSSKISSFCDDCKVRLYPETEAIDELQREITRLKAENAKEANAAVEDFITFHHNPIVKQKNEEIDRLTAALARAHEALKPFACLTSGAQYRYGSEPTYSVFKIYLHQIETAKEALADPSGKLALDRWRKMGTVKDIALKAISDEPECPDEMPDEMWAVMISSREIATKAMRLAVSETKEGITKRFLEALNDARGEDK